MLSFGLCHMFVFLAYNLERDVGFAKTTSQMLMRLRSMVSTCNQSDDGFGFDDSDSEGFTGGFFNPAAIAYFLA
jgi:hypothetical protein